ncbi:pyruvate kinase [Sulfuritalea sp.]|jgi:pyruvate kinase|uniref:pyruvate kinase n=1 Tax=Sulfuritalea sp. TaxID=2480090 RepID=UPI001ACF9846|nr:pyruvate kinase [Sulfuritalea sp.]MBN8474774.1 pyruvate kinase [Sulfuritalea sp.]
MSMLDKRVALRWRRTKIVATLGPASSRPNAIDQLLRAGVDVVRLNMSHGTHDGHREACQRVRAAARKLDRHVAILADLCGPKIRCGTFPDGPLRLTPGEEVLIDPRVNRGGPGLIPSQYKAIAKDVRPGHRILLDDGNLELKVLTITGDQVRCEVVFGGLLKDHKGINLPDSKVSAPSLPPKDIADARFAIELGVDYLALSFVRTAKDVAGLRRLIARAGASTPIIAKIETPEAIENIDAIVVASDAIMVARGDLGIELPAEQVPLVQRELIRIARQHNRAVIVATQMLESMIDHARPTRAEVGDVANAAMSGADAVMLSAETASGKFPLRAVEIMDRVLREVEGYQWQQGSFLQGEAVPRDSMDVRDGVAHAAATMARDLKLQGIIIPTEGGTTARVISAHRPTAPLVAVSTDAAVCRHLALYWGIVPMAAAAEDFTDYASLCATIAQRCKLTRTGHSVLLVSGFNDDAALNAPMLKIQRV